MSTSRNPKRALPYGDGESQSGDLWLPAADSPPVACLLHGGFWRMPYARDQLDDVAGDLAARGFAVWNLGYRRVGEEGGGWPGTMQDVSAGVDHLATLAAEDIGLDLSRVFVAGHSAGGQLALWCGSASARERVTGSRPRVRVAGVAGLAPIADLARAFELGCGGGAVRALMGGAPKDHASRYAAASPAELLPLGASQLVVHGGQDEHVPVDLSRRYAVAATDAGDPVRYVEIPDAGHMDFIDPRSGAHRALCDWLAAVAGEAKGGAP